MKRLGIPLVTMLLTACAGQPNITSVGQPNSTYSTSQTQLESRFVQMARDVSKEDNWLCFRDKCIDIGVDEEADRVQTLGAVDILKLLKENGAKKGEVITDYHLHPVNGILENGIVMNSPPSYQDLATHDGFKALFESKGYKFQSRVSDGGGTWTYDTTPDFERRFMNDLVSGNRTNMINYKAELDFPLTSKLSQEQVFDYINRVREYGVILEYTPQNEVASRF